MAEQRRKMWFLPQNKYYRNEIIYSRYVASKFKLHERINRKDRFEKEFVIIQAYSIMKYKAEFINSKIYYNDDQIYIPYLSDFIIVKQEPFEYSLTKVYDFKSMGYFDSLVDLVQDMSDTELNTYYKTYLRYLLDIKRLRKRKPCYTFYRLRSRFFANTENISFMNMMRVLLFYAFLFYFVPLVLIATFFQTIVFKLPFFKTELAVIFAIVCFLFIYLLFRVRRLYSATKLERYIDETL